MFHQNPIYGIIDQNYVQEQMRLQQQNYHNDQVWKTVDCAKKLKEFLESMDKVEPAYREMALIQCCAVYTEHVNKHRRN